MKRLFIFLCAFFVLIVCVFYGKMVDNRTNSEKLKDIQWTNENLEKWKFITDNNQTKMKFDNISIVLRDENLDCTESESRSIRSSYECRVTKVDETYIYWTITERGMKFKDAWETYYTYDVTTYLKTNIDNAQTTIIEKEPMMCFFKFEDEPIPCPQ